MLSWGIATVFRGYATAAEISNLPVSGAADNPALLLELGSAPPSLTSAVGDVRVVQGELSAQDPGLANQKDKDEILSLHPGFGYWATAFRFPLKAPPSAHPYTFWARWRQGGEPAVCEQTFDLWAGPDATHLQRRGEFRLKPKGWDYAWIPAEPTLNLQRDDKLVEIRVSGAGHDAKVFDAFLLGPPPPPAALPIQASGEKPAVLLELGKSPRWATAPKPAALQVRTGALISNSGAGGLIEEKDEVQVLHPGFGQFGAHLRFELKPPIEPGQYRFFARYKSGGEVSQVTQTFAVRAGSDLRTMVNRATFTMTNTSPWEYQWLSASSSVPLFPGDRYVEIDNSGQADGAKVFDAFLLQLEAPLQAGMSGVDAELRNRFLAQVQTVNHPGRRLYVLDGPSSAHGNRLFSGLANKAARPYFKGLQVKYLVGAEADAMARSLNLTARPAAVISDENYSLLGSLSEPQTAAEVAHFLADPQRYGKLAAIPAVADEPPHPLRNGVPESWLVGGLQDGIAGVSIYGVDTETVLRPNPEQGYLSTEMMGGTLRRWRSATTAQDGLTVIEERTEHDYRWSGGSAYAQLYLRVDRPTHGRLWLDHSGVSGAGWLDGRELPLKRDALASASSADLTLTPGWHSVLLKLVMKLDRGQPFSFRARLTDTEGKPLESVATRTSDPSADIALNRVASMLRPLIYAEAPANLPHPGDPLKLHVDLRWHPLQPERELSTPLPRFRAKLRLQIKDYGGQLVATREQDGLYPGVTSLDFGKTPETGYYAVYPSLHTPEGKLIMAYPADGFSVVGGASAQKQRLERKKLWNNYYYAFADGDRSFRQPLGLFDWLERMGIYQNYGSYPGFEAGHQALWDQARKRGLILFADTAGDSHWLNDTADSVRQYLDKVAPYTRYFKASNEIDIRREGDWQKLRSPKHWVERAQREHQRVHQARPDGHYVGGSLVKPGDTGDNTGYPDGLGPGRWFEEVLKLGLDSHVDAWDVHAYPQQSPRFGGPIGNAATEDERGVLAAYARLKRANTLPFWLGEAGAKAAHGSTGRRWQAEQAAKMIAWVNSRADYLGIAFCIGHEYDLGQGRLWDYSMGHKPGEAALYTAGALIDGLPYQAVDTKDARIQAGRFGPTLMLWRADDQAGDWTVKLDPAQTWVVVDVVGRAEPLAAPKDGNTRISLTASPVYVLPQLEYRRLTGR
jgi:hypothetical protein